MSSTQVRVRFAPSPTGLLHVGGLRSALFNWLWAKHNQGIFVLRIEDTDQSRLVEGAIDQILASLKAIGLNPDEGPEGPGEYGPYVQSKRLSLYKDHADQLLEKGSLYRCWCTPERLTQLRTEAQAKGEAFKYDRHCLNPANFKDDKTPYVLRFRIPEQPETVIWHDAVRGLMQFKSADLDDFVAIKADGFPTYQFANVVDDHLMAISHVLRADEWIPSTPKHLLLFQAFSWEPPTYAHLPAVQGPTGGKKLSKRDGAQSAQEYIADGYLPEALISFLATLGWNDGTTQEVYSADELIERFTLDRIQKSPARFDKDRLTWTNGLMIRKLSLDELMKRTEGFWPKSSEGVTEAYRKDALRLVQERLKTFSELPSLTEFFFTDPTPTVEQLTKAMDRTKAQETLQRVITALNHSDWIASDLEDTMRGLVFELGTKPGDLFGLIRVAITGQTAAPGLFETLEALGPDRSLRRMANALTLLSR